MPKALKATGTSESPISSRKSERRKSPLNCACFCASSMEMFCLLLAYTLWNLYMYFDHGSNLGAVHSVCSNSSLDQVSSHSTTMIQGVVGLHVYSSRD